MNFKDWCTENGGSFEDFTDEKGDLKCQFEGNTFVHLDEDGHHLDVQAFEGDEKNPKMENGVDPEFKRGAIEWTSAHTGEDRRARVQARRLRIF